MPSVCYGKSKAFQLIEQYTFLLVDHCELSLDNNCSASKKDPGKGGREGQREEEGLEIQPGVRHFLKGSSSVRP